MFRNHINYLHRMISVKKNYFFFKLDNNVSHIGKPKVWNMKLESHVWANSAVFTFEKAISVDKAMYIYTHIK